MFNIDYEQKQIPANKNEKGIFPSVKAIIVSIIIVVLTSLYLSFAWFRYQEMAKKEALQLTQSLGALLPSNHVANLVEKEGNSNSLEYYVIEKSLNNLSETTDTIHCAYLIGKFNDSGKLMVTSSDKMSIKELNKDMDRVDWKHFELGKNMLTKPENNKSGKWVRTLVPIKDPDKGKVVAVFGLSYDIEEWNKNIYKKMIPDFAIVLNVLILVFAIIKIWREHSSLKEKSEELKFNEALYRSVFNNIPVGILIGENEKISSQVKFRSVNPMAEKILGRDKNELEGIAWSSITHSDDIDNDLEKFRLFKNGDISSYSLEKRYIKPDGSTVWVNMIVSGFIGNPVKDSLHLCLLEDITQRKKAEETLKESERSKSVLLSHIPGIAYRTKYDMEWTVEFISEGCKELTGYTCESLIDNRALSFNDMISPKYREIIRKEWERILPQHKNFSFEYEIITKSGERKWVLELGQGVYDADDNVEALEGVIFDISEQKKREAKITYLSERDFLTGLYNRTYLEKEKKKLNDNKSWPLSIMVCDINGLRMINDSYGYQEGDKLIVEVGQIIENCCRAGDVLGRINGGEFHLVMPKTSSEESHNLAKQIQRKIEEYNRSKKQPLYEISLSVGHSTIENENQTLGEALKNAEDYLKHRKLINQRSSHYAIVSSIMAALYEKSQETEEHGQRLGALSKMIGERLGLEQKSLDNLWLLSMLHDIGKIGVDDQILNKPGKLTDEEWQQMKQHPEIGHRIAMSTPELEHIAKYILYHHERWDGKGYPYGLTGDEIPLISRIISVVDSYDAMTEDRVYSKARSCKEALDEIIRCSGTQFDPQIAQLFVSLMKGSAQCD